MNSERENRESMDETEETTGLYTIGTVSGMIQEHPETLRVWEKNDLLKPERIGSQRRYSNVDLLKLRFIKYLIDQKRLNIAGVRQLISMYPCWNKNGCKGGAHKNSLVPINESKPCWKAEGTFCLLSEDKAEMCSSCMLFKSCAKCRGCQ